jgi:outer membrane receptor for ferrienterochelin and colicins
MFFLIKEMPSFMFRIIFAALLISLGASTLHAQQATVKLVDETGETLPGVIVHLVKSGDQKANETVVSDVNGLATINIPAYPAQLEIANLGYTSFTQTINQQPKGVLNIELNKKYTGLGEVIVTGVGRPTKLDEAVSVYKIITAADIRAQGAVTLQDALRNQLGMTVGQDNILGGTIKMQGMSGDNVKILVDGLPLNGRESQNIDLSTVNMANIEKIEVAQGPMSIMYGADALGGVINLITRKNKDSWNIGGDAFYESIGKYNFGVNGAVRTGKSNISLGVGRNFFQGWDPNSDTIRDPLWRPKEQYFANLKYTYDISENASVTYGSDYMNDRLFLKGGLENFSPFVLTTKDQIITTQRWMNRLQFKWKTGNSGYWESNNAYSLYRRSVESYYTDLTTLEKTPDQSLNANSLSVYNDVTSRTTYNNKVGMLNYTFGYDVNLQFASGVEKIQNGKQSVGDYALFLITDINVTDKLKLQPALRGAYNTKYNSPLLPSMSILYKASDVWRFRASYARGFRAPTLKELYLDFQDANHSILGNENIKPEDGHHFQVSGAYTVAKQGTDFCNISLTGFYNDVTDLIALAPVENTAGVSPAPYTYVNVGKFKNVNLQLQTQSQWKQLNVVLGGSFNQNLETITSVAYNYWEVNGNVRYVFKEPGLGLSLFYKYTSKTPEAISDVTGNYVFTGNIIKDYHNLDASVDKSFWKNRVNVTAGIRNLFNNRILGPSNASTGSGGVHGGSGASDGFNLTTGRSFFTTMTLQLSK